MTHVFPEAKVFAAEDLRVGLRAEFEREISEADILAFAANSGDANPLHVDAAYASGTAYGGRLVHGAFQVGLASALIGMHLPGRSVLLAEAVSGSVVAGTYQGSIDVIDDDPAPTLTVTPIADRVTEGTALRWRVALSAPALTPLYIVLSVQPPASGTELSTTDVPAEWVQNVLFADPLPERPLSAAQGYLFVEVPAGETGFEVTVPTVVDDLAESAEQIRLTVEPFTVDPLPEPVELTGSVLG